MVTKAHKRDIFRMLVENIRRIARGETISFGGSHNFHEIYSRWKHEKGRGLEEPPYSLPDEVKLDVYRISRDVYEQAEYLEWCNLLRKGPKSGRHYRTARDYVKELEKDKDKRERVIADFVRKYRYVKRIVSISERLEISDDRLEELVQRIKPVVKHNGDLYYIENVDPRHIAFTWSPEIKEKAEGLEELARIRTYHSCGYIALFKPSIAEVLAQIPRRYLPRTAAFEIPVGINDEDPEIVASSYHRANTILYHKSN